jgi:hypothetical protein
MIQSKTWQELAASLIKAAKRAGHKYIRREPKPGGGYRYYYSEARTAAKVERGHRIRIGKHAHDVEEVDEKGRVTLKHTKTGKTETIHASELHARLHEAYRDRYERGAERMAKRILRETEGIKLDDIKANPVKAWKALGDRFTAAGVPKDQAMALLRTLGRAKGWGGDAKVMFASLASDKRLGRYVTQSRDQLMRGAANLAKAEQKRLEVDQPFTLAPVRPKHVMMAVKSRLPDKGGSAGEKTEQILRDAAGELGKLEAMLTALEAVGPAAPEAMKHYADAALKSDALAELAVAVDAYPGLANSKEAKRLRELQGRHHALTADHGKAKSDGGRGIPGAETTVFVADKTGAPTPQRARYRLVEVDQVHASHSPTKGFQPNKSYPKGLQERSYHRDKGEQNKVREHARDLHPAIVTNTNPDAANGPPIMTPDGVVLGGNSRAMTIDLVHGEGGAKQKEYLEHLKKNAATFGLSADEVDGMRAPILVREVDPPQGDLKTLVRRYNEVFTQGMDPRTDQVARAILVTDTMLDTMARGMVNERGEPKHNTLRSYLDSADGGAFIGAMERAGIIDSRNRSQYMRQKGEGKRPELNEDGKTLVERLLVGRLVPDPDTLGDVSPKQMKAIALSMPHVIRAKGSGHDLTPALAEALKAQRYMQLTKMAGPKAFDQKPELGETQAAEGSGMPTRPKLSAEGRHLLEIMYDKKGNIRGHVAQSKVFREIAEHAEKNPAQQAGMFGAAGKTTAEVVGDVRAGRHKDVAGEKGRAEAEERAARLREQREKAEQEAEAEQEAAEAAREAEAKRAQPAMMFSQIADMAKAAMQPDMFGAPAVPVKSEGYTPPAVQRGLFGDEPKKKKKQPRKGVIFRGPKGGEYLDPQHTISAKHDNPHGDKLKAGTMIRGPKGHLHEVKAVGAHSKTGKVHALVHTPRGPQAWPAKKVSIHCVGPKCGQQGLFASVFHDMRARMSKARGKVLHPSETDPVWERNRMTGGYKATHGGRDWTITKDQRINMWRVSHHATGKDWHYQTLREAKQHAHNYGIEHGRHTGSDVRQTREEMSDARRELEDARERVAKQRAERMAEEDKPKTKPGKSSREMTREERAAAAEKFAQERAAQQAKAPKPKGKPKAEKPKPAAPAERRTTTPEKVAGRPEGFLAAVTAAAEKHGGDWRKVEAEMREKHPRWAASASGRRDIAAKLDEHKAKQPKAAEKPAGKPKGKAEKLQARLDKVEANLAKLESPYHAVQAGAKTKANLEKTAKRLRAEIKALAGDKPGDIDEHTHDPLPKDPEGVSRYEQLDMQRELAIQFPDADKGEIGSFVSTAAKLGLKVRSKRDENKADMHGYDQAQHYIRAFKRAHSMSEAAKKAGHQISPSAAARWAISGAPKSDMGGITADIPTIHPVDKLPHHSKLTSTPTKPPGEGWEAVPHSKHGGFRRKKKTGKGYEYWYANKGSAKADAAHHEQKHKDTRAAASWHREMHAAGKTGQPHDNMARYEDAMAERHADAHHAASSFLGQKPTVARTPKAEPKPSPKPKAEKPAAKPAEPKPKPAAEPKPIAQERAALVPPPDRPEAAAGGVQRDLFGMQPPPKRKKRAKQAPAGQMKLLSFGGLGELVKARLGL